MSAMVWITMGTIGVVSPLVYLRMRRKNAISPASSARGEVHEYAAVSITPGLIACEAVERLAGKRMLENEAPQLPVTGCNEKQCKCRYRYHSDRRSGEDQREPFGTAAATTMVNHSSDQRSGTDRRKSKKLRARPVAYYNDYS